MDRWVELIHASATTLEAIVDEILTNDVAGLQDVSEPLEDRPVLHLVGVMNELLVIAVFAVKVLIEHVNNGPDSPAPGGIGKQVDNRLRRIGDVHAPTVTPDMNQPDVPFERDGMEEEFSASDRRLAVSRPARRRHNHASEDLLSEIPVLSGAPSSDVRRLEEHAPDDPRILVG